MKLLLDSCVSPSLIAELVAHGHEATWVGDWPADPGDSDILERALRNCATIVTLDKDFGELAVAFGQAHSAIIRLVNLPLARQAGVCLAAVNEHGTELEQGAIVTAEPGRLRIRPPPVADLPDA